MTGTSNYLARWTNSSTLGIGTVYDDGSKVGIGTTSVATESRLALGALNAVDEGGQLQLNAPGGSYTTAFFIDNYQNQLRFMHGTNSASNGTRMLIDNAGNVGIGGLFTPTHILHITAQGRSTQSAWATTSDSRVKRDVETLGEGSLERILKLRPVTYGWQQEYLAANPALKASNTGFISQELEQVFPEMVEQVEEKFGDRTINDFRLLNLSDLPVHLVRAMQELNTKVEAVSTEGMVSREEFEALQAKNDRLEKLVEQLIANQRQFEGDLQQCCFEHSVVTSEERPVTSGLTDAPKLEQNIPNPFNENTTIRYYLPNGTRTASIVIADLNGVQLKSFDLGGTRGFGQVLISGGAFAAGTYIYTLTVNGKQVDSKRMVLL